MPRPWRVLLVDDDADSRELYAGSLGNAGFEVLQAGDGAEALAAVAQRLPDVIVMGLEMPGMSGLEAIRRLRADACTRAIPVVVLTGSGFIDRTNARRAGSAACLVKPCLPAALEGVVRALVESSPPERAPHGGA